MSKNTELFINLCNFMKYFLNEVLPENEPTELLKNSTKELLFALIDYTKQIKCDISPVYLKNDIRLSATKVLVTCVGGESILPTEPETRPVSLDRTVNGTSESSRRSDSSSPGSSSLGTNPPATRHPQNHLSTENGNYQQNSGVTSTSENYLRNNSSNSSEEFSSDTEENDDDNDSDVCFLEDCFLKSVFLSEPGVRTSLSNVKNKSKSSSNTPVKVSQKINPRRTIISDSIPLEFVEVNRCLMEKLLGRANYCWECGFCIAEAHFMQNHLDQHNAENQDPTSNFVLINICEKCSFLAVLPKSLVLKFKQYHVSQHSLPTINPAYDKYYLGSQHRGNHLIFIKNLLIKKNSEETILKQFLGICLICDSFFNSPLEWNCHLFEYQHLKNHKENIVTCAYCCLVILGLNPELMANDYLKLYEHAAFCRGGMLLKAQTKRF